MTKTLIISLNNDKELIESSFLCNSIKKQNPHKEISILTYSDLKGVAEIISNVDHVFTINRSDQSSLYQNKLFSQGFAINSFLRDLQMCLSQKWDEVVNYSNTKLTAYLTTYLSSEIVHGASLTQNLCQNWSNEWEAYETFAHHKSLPIHPIQTKHYISGLNFFTEGTRLKINQEFNNMAHENFKRIRRSKAEGNTYVIGISLIKDEQDNRLNISSLTHFIENLENTKHYKPVLILGSNPQDKELCNKLNQNFNNQLISITADTDAITSVIGNIDLLVTTNNIHSSIAQAQYIPTIEVISMSDRPSIIIPNSYIIKTNNFNFHDEVCFLLNNIFENELPVDSVAKHSKVFQSISDEYSTYYTQISGKVDVESELHYHLARTYHFELMGESANSELLEHIANHTDKEDLLNFIELNKSELTKCVKILLATLRSLKGINQSNDNKRNFVHYLDELFSFSSSESLVNVPVTMFAGKIENIQSNTTELNLKEIETLLFGLKNKLQRLTNTLEILINKENVAKKEIVSQH